MPSNLGDDEKKREAMNKATDAAWHV